MKRLISNTSFGEFCKSKEKEFSTRNVYLDWYEEIRTNYDNFLKQPLNLGMFVPCYEDVNVYAYEYEEPIQEDYWSENGTVYSGELFKHDLNRYMKYKKAKEKVLFEGIEFRKNGGVNFLTIKEDTFAFFDFNVKFKNLTIEYLIQYDLQLTENAVKQIRL